MRTHIAKSLQKRCKAIRTAVKQYNAAAAALNPPRPPLDWDKVSHFSFLEEFTLLQDTRNDLRAKEWAQPLVRETMRSARRITRAEEELGNVNREARRLHTSIVDEDALFSDVLRDLKVRGDLMYGPVHDFCRRRRTSNAHNLAHLLRLYSLDGFTGTPGPGKHAGLPREIRSTAADATTSATSEDVDMQPPHSPTSPMDVALPPPAADTVLDLTAIEASALDADEHSDPGAAEEDDIGEVTGLYDHLANIAAVM
ncbi:hypothetical protein K466DRAFT_604781 [Polyporus arcularius HHB13444]|uniref:Uncharacterized protein n=1 Tax=Polyporus arcularius HHB13444 TaxID=1314778 RepID=A0A5C3P5L0_9APHY|nr:hypothetical protein K466DRAFT_604781 [Polyporus arcularius HHB13444]